MKIHLLDEYGMKQFNRPYGPVCGKRLPFVNIGREVIRDRCVKDRVFRQLPKQAQCQACSSRPECATQEQIHAVEVSLIAISRVWEPELTARTKRP